MTATPCEHCGALPKGVGGSTGTHRRDCPGRELADILADWLRRLDDLEQLLSPSEGGGCLP